jgi:hypothetical protein
MAVLPRHYSCVKPSRKKEGAGPRKRGLLAKSGPSRIVEVLTVPPKQGDQHMKTHDKFVGLDVHKDTIVITAADAGREGAVRAFGTIRRRVRLN